MRKRSLIILLAFLPLFGSVNKCRAQEVVDSICAIVDNEPILESEVGYGVSSILLERGNKRPSPEQILEARAQVLRAFIAQKILLAKAVEDTLSVEDRVVDKELGQKFAQIVQQVGDEQKLAEYFGRPVTQIKREMRKGVRESLLIDKVRRQHIGSPQIRKQEVIDFYNAHVTELPTQPERVGLSHILIGATTSEEARAEARKKIELAMHQLESGADFDSVAMMLSDDASASNGGKLGFTNRGDLVTEYEEAAYALDLGEISQIVESRYGFHIIKLIERQGERISTQHILVALNPVESDWQRADSLALALKAQVLAGENFEELAGQYSTDESSKKKGGELDVMPVDQLPAEFKAAITGLEPNEIAAPFRTSFGVHLVRMNQHIPERKVSLEGDWPVLEQFALNAKHEEAFQRWIRGQMADHFIWPDDLRARTVGN